MRTIYYIFKNNIGKYKKDCIKAILFVLLECLFISLIPLFTGKLMELGVENHNAKKIIIYSILVLVSSMLYLFFGIISIKSTMKGSYGFVKNLREKLFCKIMDLSFKNRNKFTIGELINRATTDIFITNNFFIAFIRFALVGIITLIISIVLVFNIDINVSKAFIYVYPFVIIIMVFLTCMTLPLFIKVITISDKLNNNIIESVDAIKLVKSLNKENYEIEKFKKISEEYLKINVKSNSLFNLSLPVSDIARYGVMLLIAWFGAKYIIISNNDQNLGFTTGGITALMTYAGVLYTGISQIVMVGILFVTSIISMKRIANVFELKNEFQCCAENDNKILDGSIEFKNVNFSYYGNVDRCILKNISFNIKSGEVVGIFGKTSSGKTTLASLIPRFYETLSGDIFISGKNIKEYSFAELRKNIAFVFQKTNLFNDTILNNIRMFDDSITEEDVKNACEIAEANTFINEKKGKYNEEVSEGGVNLSGGQCQRISIARATVKKPKILILDDSFSALDSKTAIKIKNNLKTKLKGTTIIIISDRLETLSDVDKMIYV